MLKYAKVVNDSTKLCDIGTGTNEKYYKSVGMTQQDVEQAWNGDWYLTGHAPEKPAEVVKQERIEELKRLLADTDYKGQKYLDGEYTDEEWQAIVAERKAWREEIRELEK